MRILMLPHNSIVTIHFTAAISAWTANLLVGRKKDMCFSNFFRRGSRVTEKREQKFTFDKSVYCMYLHLYLQGGTTKSEPFIF